MTSLATRALVVVVAGSLAAACAAGGSKAAPPASSPAAAAEAAPAGYPPQSPAQPGYAQPPPAPPAPEFPGQLGGAAGSRSVALRGAASELESSQRELDVAAGDCRNACRALGSMDRAAGRLCELAQSSDEQRTCTEAKGRVYSARDKVKSTCRSCPGGPSVESTAPIPSIP
ncbi:MAG: hypothetical protein KF819_20315 [Labilithrix sp.]|nr:hypothetical protein [Labilithrix sp.]